MRCSRIAVTVAAAMATALSGGTALATVNHGPPARAASKLQGQIVVISCLNRAEVRPDFFMLACGDGTAYLTKLRWSSWTGNLASGTAEFSLNPCDPSCAQGKFITSPVVLLLWQTAPIPHRPGKRQFLRMTIIYTGKRPAGTAQSFTESLWYPTRY